MIPIAVPAEKWKANMSGEAAISVRGLEKIYKGRRGAPDKHALKGIDLDIPRGSMFALLGPNGAGKSTFINILAGLVNKTGGSARVWGFDIDENPRNAKVSIGVVPQELFFDAFFTPFELLEMQAGLYGVPPANRRTMDILEMVGLEDQRDAYARTLSGGMKRRLLIAKAMVHSPPILVLDEPTAGVDIELRQQLWRNVREMNDHGITIVLTTHYLEEAEQLCNIIAIINHGEVVACEPKEELLSRIDEKEIIIDFSEQLTEIPPALAGLNSQLVTPNRISVQVNKSTTSMGEILASITSSGLTVTDLTTSETDLEDVFLQLTRGDA
ncbi:MAG: ABC transporter ATP-binding protein [Proteobacteria bacterium]|nr:ABC transporter ATP-binding protein [Pseudomonadota bacterium]